QDEEREDPERKAPPSGEESDEHGNGQRSREERPALARDDRMRIYCAHSVLAGVDEAVALDPGHHLAQPLPHLLDRQLRRHAPAREERGRARPVLEHELLGVLARLDAVERLLHALSHGLIDDLGAGYILAEFG